MDKAGEAHGVFPSLAVRAFPYNLCRSNPGTEPREDKPRRRTYAGRVSAPSRGNGSRAKTTSTGTSK
ncbi:hypothetical protein Ait01nite_004340 [Actinoplanes italicus]|nr:hypothetical protein Ait01nite_004340 [Actinoplanes italicus]